MPRHQALLDAKQAIGFLIDRGNYWEGTKQQFAFALDWRMPNGKDADVRRVQTMCTLTRDQSDLDPWMQEQLAGMIIAYSPTDGGMVLIDPDSPEMPLRHHIEIIRGDLVRHRVHKTENRRRIPTLNAAAKIAFEGGDFELAQVLAKAEDQVDRTGTYTETIEKEFFKIVKARGLVDL